MTGRVLRSLTLTSASGRSVPVRLLRPDYSAANQTELVRTWLRWRTQAKALEASHPDAAIHAAFASEVAWLAALRLRAFADEPREILIVAVGDVGDEVLGLNTAYWVPDEQAWYMAVGTTRPADQPGNPNPDQVRGIGSAVVGALVGEMNAIVCAPVTLKPLDEEAHRFWAARGFHDVSVPGGEMAMTCPESRELQRRLAGAPPDCPDQGDCTATDESRRVPRPPRRARTRAQRHPTPS